MLDASRKVVLFTDGRKLQKSKDDSYQEIAAHWSGSQLITDEKSPQGAKMSRTFELAQDGRQFFETIHVDRGRSKGQLVVRYVYDVATGQESQLTRENDPDQPVMKRRSDNSSGGDTSSQSTPSGQGSDPDQPVMKRKSDDSGVASTPQGGPSNSPPDPDQPVMKRRTGQQ
jgi:hypothetical protein